MVNCVFQRNIFYIKIIKLNITGCWKIYTELFYTFKHFIEIGEISNDATTPPAENMISGLSHSSLVNPRSHHQDRSNVN